MRIDDVYLAASLTLLFSSLLGRTSSLPEDISILKQQVWRLISDIVFHCLLSANVKIGQEESFSGRGFVLIFILFFKYNSEVGLL